MIGFHVRHNILEHMLCDSGQIDHEISKIFWNLQVFRYRVHGHLYVDLKTPSLDGKIVNFWSSIITKGFF